MLELMVMLDKDEVIRINNCKDLNDLENYMDYMGIDPDDYRMEKHDGFIELWRA